MSVALRPCSVDVFLRDVTTRLPFRFGVHTMTAAPLCLLRVTAEAEGQRVEGWSSDLLVPRWFEKTPGQSIAEDWNRLCTGIRAAAEALLDDPSPATPFDHWWRIDATCRDGAGPDRSGGLLHGHGPALVERALIDAACRAAHVAFASAVRGDLLGFDAERLAASLGDVELAPPRTDRPLDSLALRHTIGLLDPISPEEVTDDPADGLPVDLASILEETGVTHLKIKLSGDQAHDIARLTAIARVVESAAAGPVRVTMDGNEQYESVSQLAEVFAALRSSGAKALLDDLLLIEQPLPRGATFDAAASKGLSELPAPCIIDEADVDLAAYRDAAALGYGGVSTKNCKGVFRALFNDRVVRAVGGVQSAEDLTNLPVVALQQDLVTAAVLGIDHIERNGHHYFRGLDHLPAREQMQALRAHGDLYEQDDRGGRLRVRDGRIAIASLHDCPGYAHAHDVDLSGWTPIEEWKPIVEAPA